MVMLYVWCRKNELEETMLMNLQKKTWTEGLTLRCAKTGRVSIHI